MIEHKGKEYLCHLDLAMEMIKGKWKAVIICHLNDKPLFFNELRRTITGVTQKVLQEKLVELLNDQLIYRKLVDGSVPKVEYGLTETGKELFEPLSQIEKWAVENIKCTESI
jgi:DNA-binding HxlR family transcriptional regulator